MTVIGTNISAMRAANASNAASSALATSMERLSTGKSINSAKDNAAGLAIASRMTSAVKSMAVAVRNANDGISLAQTAEGALGEVTNMLQRMKELATQSASGTLKDSDRTTLQSEVRQLTAEIGNISDNTSFNGVKLLDGSSGAVKLQTGINSGETITMNMVNVSARSLNMTKTVGAVDSNSNIELMDITGGATASVNGAKITSATSAKEAAALITAGGVTATANANVASFTFTAPAPAAATTLRVGDVDVSLETTDDTAAKVATKINSALAASGKDYGIKASTTGTTNLTLRAVNGENISIKAPAVLTAPVDGAGTAITGTLTSGITAKGTVTVNSADGSDIAVDADTAVLTAMNVSQETTQALDISTQDSASAALATIDAALDKISAGRGDLGAVQNRLQVTVNNLTTSSTNLADAKSRIEDTDFSAETTALAKAQILSQASTAMLSQANQSQQSVLKLLQ